MPSLKLPSEVREVIICADGDKAGEDAARKAAVRFVHEGRKARMARPGSGLDFNDLLRGEVKA
jgi:DNA primase